MKFSEQWLRKWVNPDITTTALCEQFTMAGLEVESVTPLPNNLEKIVIGELLEVARHPNADRLHLCEVNIGAAESLSIVCGADNVRSGLKVPVALLDARLADGTKIKAAKIRGVDSQGMLCSTKELDLGEDAKGILELPSDAPLGEDLKKYLFLEDNIIELNITPNRADCFCMKGLAREVAALNNCQITAPELQEIALTSEKNNFKKQITITAKTACPRYLGYVVRNVNLKATTPIWLQECLRRNGLRPINSIVDVANYVMLELGQPLHAFDLAKLDGDISVRFAKENEEIALLDGTRLKLTCEDLLIADEKKPLALAGIMGSGNSEVSDDTKDIFLESAFFAPPIIAKCARKHGLHTDASHRFERGVDPNLQHQAVQRALQLLQEISGGEVLAASEVTFHECLPQKQPINLRSAQVKRILGIDLTDDEIIKILQRLNMEVQPVAQNLQVTPPGYRFDLNLEIDLIEEIARIYGYDQIEASEMVLPLANKSSDATLSKRKRLSLALVDQGYREVITYGFVDTALQKLLNSEPTPIALANPIAEDLAVMRTSIWPGLIKTVLYNQNRRQERLRFFEIGLCFLPANEEGGSLQQPLRLAAIATGDTYPEQWALPKRDSNFFDLKNDLENLLKLFVDLDKVQFKPKPHPALHTQASAEIYLHEKPIGFLGKLHPKLYAPLNLTKTTCLFELDLSFLQEEIALNFRPTSKFPLMRRDLAIVLDEKITWLAIQEKIKSIQSDVLQNVTLFDIYQGQGITTGQKSIALRLTFQAQDRTLTEHEIDILMQKILALLVRDFHAKIRG